MNSSLEKLSSGYSINSAADNAAGLAISEKMRSQIEGLDQASSNSQDAISLTQTADGALDETTSILKRMRELAVQASSDTLTDDDRTAIQDEVDQLRQEIDRISNDTEYNTKKLLNGDSGSSTAVSGTDSAAIVASSTTAGNNTADGTYTVEYTSVATQATTGSASTATTNNLNLTSTSDASSYAGDVSINGTTISIQSGDTIEGVLEKINAESDTTGVTATFVDNSGDGYIQLSNADYGSDSEITVAADNGTLQNLFAATTDDDATSVTVNGTDATGLINGAVASAEGNTLTAFDLTVTGDDDALAELSNSYATTNATAIQDVADAQADVDTDITALVSSLTASTASTATADNAAAAAYTSDPSTTNLATLLSTAASSTDATTATNLSTYNTDNATLTTAQNTLAAIPVASAKVDVDTSSALTFQVGANSNQTMTLSISDMDANALGVAGNSSTTGIDLSTADNATNAITTIDAAIKKVSAERSNLGAVQNSLESNINNLDTESENLSSAESNIRDTDMATEMANYTKLSVITQAATAMLAKANQQPQQVLTLLQG